MLSICHFDSHAVGFAVSGDLVILHDLDRQPMHQVAAHLPRGCWILHVDARVALSHQRRSKHHGPQAHSSH